MITLQLFGKLKLEINLASYSPTWLFIIIIPTN